MARGDQVPMPGVSEKELADRREKASEELNLIVAAVERLTVELRQAKADERRARARLAAFYK